MNLTSSLIKLVNPIINNNLSVLIYLYFLVYTLKLLNMIVPNSKSDGIVSNYIKLSISIQSVAKIVGILIKTILDAIIGFLLMIVLVQVYLSGNPKTSTFIKVVEFIAMVIFMSYYIIIGAERMPIKFMNFWKHGGHTFAIMALFKAFNVKYDDKIINQESQKKNEEIKEDVVKVTEPKTHKIPQPVYNIDNQLNEHKVDIDLDDVDTGEESIYFDDNGDDMNDKMPWSDIDEDLLDKYILTHNRHSNTYNCKYYDKCPIKCGGVLRCADLKERSKKNK